MRVKERHRGEEELQEGCVSFRASEGRGKGATHLSCTRGEQAVVRGQTGTWPWPEKEKGELQEVSWKGGGGSEKDQRCPGREAKEMFDFASQKCSRGQTLLRWGGCGMRQPPPAPSPAPNAGSPEVSKPLAQRRFSAIPRPTNPPSSPLVSCARLCPPRTSPGHRAQQRRSSSSPEGQQVSPERSPALN